MRFLLLAVLVTLAFSVVVDNSIEEHFKLNKKADVIVYMNDYLDLDRLHYKGKHLKSYTVDERAQLIVDALQLKADDSQKSIRALLKSQNIDFEVMWNVNGLLVRNVDQDFISVLAKDNSIEQIGLDKKVDVEEFETNSIQKVEDSQQDVIEWNVKWVKAPEVWAKGYQGAGILVGVGDTGLAYKHEAIVHSYNGTLNEAATEFNHNYNWADPVGKTKEPRDTQGHGSRYPDMITVGATGQNSDTIASFSSTGPNPDNEKILKPTITAPGQSVTSAAARGGYTAMSGTSMSTPNVAGGVALIMSAVPELRRNIAAVNKVLTETALKQKSDVCAPKGSPNGQYGHGTVNYLKAIEVALELKRKNML